jgi:hypothetical protein
VRRAHASVRHAALYKQVDDWANSPPANTTATQEDVDLDGESEYLLANAQVLAVFEAIGGRLVAGFARNTQTGRVFQMIGTQPAYPGSDTEEEGAASVSGEAVAAHRTSGFKDWFADGSGGGTSQYVNALYSVSAAGTDGWTFTAPGGHVVKTITLADTAPRLDAQYALSGEVDKLYVRMGLSPDLESLLVRGQQDLAFVHVPTAGRLELRNTAAEPVTAIVDYTTATASYNGGAVDDDPGGGTEWDTINMRNQAFTQQVELENVTGQASFGISLAMETAATDGDDDGLPDWWEDANMLGRTDDGSGDPDNGPDGDPDNDGINNLAEWLFGLNPQIDDRNLAPRLVITSPTADPRLSFPTLPDRLYQLQISSDLVGWSDHGAPASTVGEGGPGTLEIDDPGLAGVRFYRIVVSSP